MPGRGLLTLAFAIALLAAAASPALAEQEKLAGCDPAPSPQRLDGGRPINLGQLKRQLIHYRCTRYDSEIGAVMRRATAWITHAARHVRKPALVLDIDETSLSNWKEIYQNDFGYIPGGPCDFSDHTACGQGAWEKSASAVAIRPTLDLFNAARAQGVAVFFITGRHEEPDERKATEANLHTAGYDGWQHLYMRTADFTGPSPAPFKTWARKEIEAQGYAIIANIGDQQSDLVNGHARRTFKLPNPFYFIP